MHSNHKANSAWRSLDAASSPDTRSRQWFDLPPNPRFDGRLLATKLRGAVNTPSGVPEDDVVQAFAPSRSELFFVGTVCY